jgi:hypothetical protein
MFHPRGNCGQQLVVAIIIGRGKLGIAAGMTVHLYQAKPINFRPIKVFDQVLTVPTHTVRASPATLVPDRHYLVHNQTMAVSMNSPTT